MRPRVQTAANAQSIAAIQLDFLARTPEVTVLSGNRRIVGLAIGRCGTRQVSWKISPERFGIRHVDRAFECEAPRIDVDDPGAPISHAR